MWQVISKLNDKFRKADYDTEAEARRYLNMIVKWEGVTGIQLIHYRKPIKPSMAPLHGDSGYRRDIQTGWKQIESSTITHRNYTVKFEAYADATIDTFCDALNGWHTEWTAWKATFKSQYGVYEITTHKRDVIDHLFEVINSIEPYSDPELSEEELARSYFRRIALVKKPG